MRSGETPLYGIVHISSNLESVDYQPIVSASMLTPQMFRTPHMFDAEVEPSLEAIRFVLFLPPTFDDAVRMQFKGFRFFFKTIMPHRILQIPWPAITKKTFKQLIYEDPPFHWFVPADLIEPFRKYLSELGLQQNVTSFSDLTSQVLSEIWQRIYKDSPSNNLGSPNGPFCDDLTRKEIGLSLPTALLAQRVSPTVAHEWKLPTHSLSLLEAIQFRSFILAADAYHRLEKIDENPEEFLRSVKPQCEAESRFPIMLAAPGESPSYLQFADSVEAPPRTHEDFERRDYILSLITAHRAIARSGLALQVSDLPRDLFARLSELEIACSAKQPRPLKIWRIIQNLSDSAQFVFDGDAHFSVLKKAAPLQIFSDFPIGLLIPPGASAPLQFCVPTIYRPLTPLTRTLQHELFQPPRIDLTGGFKVLIAECLDPSDRIAGISWCGLSNIVNRLGQSSICSFDLERISSEKDLKRLLRKQYDVLVLSTHGIYSREGGATALLIGGTPSMLNDIDQLPPIVFLSACHTAPRGLGAVSVADLLLRKGARAILGTLVPIRVDRNAIFLFRLLLYMEQTVAGNEPLHTLEEVFHKVLVLNAVHDFETTCNRCMKWMASSHPFSGKEIINEFKHNRSIGRVRPHHIYSDTKDILFEIAKETGDEGWFQAQMSSGGVFPETAFYMMIGNADDIVLREEKFYEK